MVSKGVENLRIKHQEYFKKVGWLVLNPYFNANFSFKHVAYQPPETPILWHSCGSCSVWGLLQFISVQKILLF